MASNLYFTLSKKSFLKIIIIHSIFSDNHYCDKYYYLGHMKPPESRQTAAIDYQGHISSFLVATTKRKHEKVRMSETRQKY